MLGHKFEHKLLDIRLRLDMMTVDEVRWTPHKLQEIRDIWAHPIHPMEARRPVNNKMYVVRNLFVEVLRLETPSHLLTKTWTNVPTILPSACIEDYMQLFLPRIDPRLQNPLNVPPGFHVLVDPPMPATTLLDLIAREVHRDDLGKEEKYDTIADLLTRYYRST
ncbi:hypothetical protein M9H77_04486 [Catharanthus roseus]|uniref:Uncharacterized protein n=1 Tax=Catharanthus roseus TaxID=4058 RepID=A0ACC0CE55_CATRO|nr:hypothetical protein M9H77_04486 [Catharanthus roseus]